MIEMHEDVLQALLREAWRRGFDFSSEGRNGDILLKRDKPIMADQIHKDILDLMRLAGEQSGNILY